MKRLPAREGRGETRPIRTGSPVALAALIVILAAPLAAQDLNYRDRDDRREGVIVEQDISGGQVELVGLRREMIVPVAAASGKVTLAFWLDAGRELEVSVRHYRKNYWMVPHQKSWEPGWQSFAWSRGEVIDKLSLQPADLSVIIRDPTQGTYYPGVLAVGGAAAGDGRYRFDFHVRGGLDAEARIVRLGEGGPQVIWRTRVEKDASGMTSILWNGRDQDGEAVAPGTLYLRLEGYIVLTDRDEEFVREVPFRHGTADE
jgi:hypothetical protein